MRPSSSIVDLHIKDNDSSQAERDANGVGQRSHCARMGVSRCTESTDWTWNYREDYNARRHQAKVRYCDARTPKVHWHDKTVVFARQLSRLSCSACTDHWTGCRAKSSLSVSVFMPGMIKSSDICKECLPGSSASLKHRNLHWRSHLLRHRTRSVW